MFLRRRLGDKAWSRAWASGSPRPQHVWWPAHRIRRRLGTNGVRRTPTAMPWTLVVGKGTKRIVALQEVDRTPTGRSWKSTARPSRQPLRAGNLPCESFTASGVGWLEEERRRWTDLDLRLAAPLLVSTSQLALHLHLAVRPCHGATPASSHVTAPVRTCSCDSASSLPLSAHLLTAPLSGTSPSA